MAGSRKSSLCLARGLSRAFLKHPPPLLNHHNYHHTPRLLSCSSFSTNIFSSTQYPLAPFCLYPSQTHSLTNNNITNFKSFSPNLCFKFSSPRSYSTNASASAQVCTYSFLLSLPLYTYFFTFFMFCFIYTTCVL